MNTRLLTFVQPRKVPSENALKRAALSPRGRGAAQGIRKDLDEWKQAAFYAWKQQRSGAVGAVLGQPCNVRVRIGFRVSRTRDPHNYVGTIVKSVVDGLVLANVWPDDNPEWVTVLEPELFVQSGPEHLPIPCTVELTPRG